MRTVTVPDWVYDAVRQWLDVAQITNDKERIFRAVHKSGKICGQGLTDSAVWEIVLHYARLTSLGRLAPHDLRRSCAKLCRQAGGSLEQIQFLLAVCQRFIAYSTTELYSFGIVARSRLDSNHGALPGRETGIADRGQRYDGN